jgi:fatty acid desaturase
VSLTSADRSRAAAEERVSTVGRDFHDLTADRSTEAWSVAYLLLSWGAVGAAVAGFWRRRTPLSAVAAIAVITSRQQALLNMEHDAIHRSLFRDRAANDLVGIVAAGAPCGSGLRSTRAQHLRHHRSLNTPDDPDAGLHQGPHLETRAGLVRHLVEGFTGIYAVKIARRRETWVTPEVARRDKRDLLLVNAGLWAAFTRATAWWTYPALWLAPLLTVTSGFVVVRNYIDHALVDDELDKWPDRRVSVDARVAEGAVVSPFNMNWHAEHHMFPWVPARRLPEAARRLRTHAAAPAQLVRRSYLLAIAEHLRALP